jgi:hypothetical protein
MTEMERVCQIAGHLLGKMTIAFVYGFGGAWGAVLAIKLFALL